MLETVIYADIGSAVTKLESGGKVVCETTRAALDPQNGSRVLAVGNRCLRLLNTVEVYPVRKGAIANPSLTAIMLRRLALDLLHRRSLCGIELRMLIPRCSPQLNRIAAAETAATAGFRKVRLLDSLLLAALGAGVDIRSPSAAMAVDIGRDKTGVIVCANGGSVCQSLHDIGSADFDRAIQHFFASEHALLISSETAESIKKSLAMPVVGVNGRGAGDGSFRRISVSSKEIAEALAPVYRALANELAEAVNNTPPDAAADICDNGVVLTGGGALLCGVEQALEPMLGVPVRIAQNADIAAVCGASACASFGIGKKELFRSMMQA